MAYKSVFIILIIGGCLSAPIDDPVRIDLPVFDQPQASSDVLLSQGVGIEDLSKDVAGDQSTGSNFITYKLQAATNLLGNKLDSKANYFNFGGIVSPPVTTLESAIQETEGLPSKALSYKENIQTLVVGLFQPKPIVDTINEDEKYGNTGDKFYGVGQAVVGGASGVSNLLNAVLEVPGTIFRKITRAASEKLNNLGGKLIGL